MSTDRTAAVARAIEAPVAQSELETFVESVASTSRPPEATHHHHHHHYYHRGRAGDGDGDPSPDSRDASFASPASGDGDASPALGRQTDDLRLEITRERVARARDGLSVGSQWRVFLSLILCAHVMDYHRTIIIFNDEELREMDRYVSDALARRRAADARREPYPDADIYDYVFVPQETDRTARLTIARNSHNVAIVHELDAEASEDLRALARVKRRSLQSSSEFKMGTDTRVASGVGVNDRMRFLFTKVVRNVGVLPFERRQYFYKHVNSNVLAGVFSPACKFKDVIEALWRTNRV